MVKNKTKKKTFYLLEKIHSPHPSTRVKNQIIVTLHSPSTVLEKLYRHYSKEVRTNVATFEKLVFFICQYFCLIRIIGLSKFQINE